MDSASDEQSSSCSSRQTDSRAILQEVRSEFDGIRFASYRCAAKLRFIQKRTNCECCGREGGGHGLGL